MYQPNQEKLAELKGRGGPFDDQYPPVSLDAILVIRGYPGSLEAVLCGEDHIYCNLHEDGHPSFKNAGYIYEVFKIEGLLWQACYWKFEKAFYEQHREIEKFITQLVDASEKAAKFGASRITGDWYGDGWALCVPCTVAQQTPVIYEFQEWDRQRNRLEIIIGSLSGNLRGSGTSSWACPGCVGKFQMFEGM
jgi:hypothetical protein